LSKIGNFVYEENSGLYFLAENSLGFAMEPDDQKKKDKRGSFDSKTL
jgi:hypothetical protein